MVSSTALSPHELVRQIEALNRAAANGLSASEAPLNRVPAPACGKCCVILSPHPDDECITGALALRLLRESGWRVVNLAITHGSNPERQLARAAELQSACTLLGFDNFLLAECGLVRISRASREGDLRHWAQCVGIVAAQFRALRPDLIICPHATDAQAAHIGTHLLALDALQSLGTDVEPLVAFTEYWSTMTTPNLMVEVDAHDLGDLMTALMLHAGEVSRNPYHLSLPAWMMDNVRRGAELVGRPGGPAPGYTFATLYQVMRWRGGALVPAWAGGRFAPRGLPLALDALLS